MKSFFTKFISITLILALLVPMFAACSENKDTTETPADDTTPAIDVAEDTTTVAEEETGSVIYETGLEKVDMGGREFVFLNTNWSYNGHGQWSIHAEEYNGEAINDGKHERNLYMAENFNCTVRVENAFDPAAAQKMFSQSVIADDGAYQFFFIRLNQYMGIATEGLLYDFAKVPYINMDAIYWDSNAYEALSIANIHFVTISDVSLEDKVSTSKILFNKTLYNDLQLEDPYQMVRDGKWTQDVLYEHMQLVSEDVNGDSVMNMDDKYGMVGLRDALGALMNAGDAFLALKDENDIPVLTIGDEIVMNKVIKIIEMMADELHFINQHKYNDTSSAQMINMFKENRALYLCDTSGFVFSLREMDTDFGILPIPKGSEDQENYYSEVSPWVGMVMGMPVNTPDDDLDMIGTFLEEYACQGRNMVVPAFYDKLLTGKMARDEESIDMLDIIYTSRGYDIGGIGNWMSLTWDLLMMAQNGNTNIASFAKSKQKSVTKRIAQMVEAINEKYQ